MKEQKITKYFFIKNFFNIIYIFDKCFICYCFNMNIYKRKSELSDILLWVLAFGVIGFVILCPTLFCLSSYNIISSAVAWGSNIAMIIILACLEAKVKNLGKEMDEIEDALPFSRDIKEEMLATFNDRELNKMLEISRQRDNEKKEQEKRELQETIKDIKEKFHL